VTEAEATSATPKPGPAPSAWEDPPRAPASATSPTLAVDGFEGPLDWLLEMARARRIDLARLSILALVEAFTGAMDAALARGTGAPAPDLARWAGWTVMASHLAELRSRLLLPADAPQARAARAEAEALRRHWVSRAETAGAVAWLERRPQLGFNVFARGRPEAARAGRGAGTGDAPEGHETCDGLEACTDAMENEAPVPGGDITDLLRACLAALRPPPNADTHQPGGRPFWGVGDAAARINRLLAGLPEGADLASFLPEIAEAGASRALHCRVAVSATLLASLELARDGALTLRQDTPWRPIHVRQRDPVSSGNTMAPS